MFMFLSNLIVPLRKVEKIFISQLSKTKNSTKKAYIIRSIIVALFIPWFLYIIMSTQFMKVKYSSNSMYGTIQKGDEFMVLKNIDKDKIERDKIYVFNHDNDIDAKRCIGISGDHIVIKGNDVYRNDELLKEEYVSSEVSEGDVLYKDMDVLVPKGKIFVLGDNRALSYDSRTYEETFVDVDDIVGIATIRTYPLNRYGSLYEDENK